MKKTFNNIKNFIKDNKVFFITLILGLTIMYFPLPYYVEAPGGLIDLEDKIKVEDGYDSKGTINMTYVSSYQGNIPILFLSLFKKDWDIMSYDDVIPTGTTKSEYELGGKLDLEDAFESAIISAYTLAGKEINIKNEKCYITYIDELSNTDLKIGDEIISYDNNEISDFATFKEYILSKKDGDIIKFKVINNSKTIERSATVFDHEGVSLIGIELGYKREYTTDPKIEVKSSTKEYGSSGGLMTAIAIYDNLVKEDLTNGKIIAGTGTINSNGVVGPIGGIKYKLAGAVDNKAYVFLAPSYINYDEAVKEKEENDYDIEIVKVETLEDAINYLNK